MPQSSGEDPQLMFDKWLVNLEPSAEPSSVKCLLMPQHAYACNLSSKKWQHIWVDGIKDIDWNKTCSSVKDQRLGQKLGTDSEVMGYREARSQSNLGRNSFVAIFSRMLE